MYIHVHDFMKLSEYVHTWLYHVQTRMYRFAQSCPGGQDSRWTATAPLTVTVCGHELSHGPAVHVWDAARLGESV